MKIKSRYKIGQFWYKVIKLNILKSAGLSDVSGASSSQFKRIFIDTEETEQEQEATLIHETLEEINKIYDVGLNHHQIELLEITFHQWLTENRLLK